MPQIMKVKDKKVTKMADASSDFRLPLDLLLIHDVDTLEDALKCQFAIEHENEIQFCKDRDELQSVLEELDGAKYYEIDDIETDRIEAIIELLNMAEKDNLLGHVLDRIVR